MTTQDLCQSAQVITQRMSTGDSFIMQLLSKTLLKPYNYKNKEIQIKCLACDVILTDFEATRKYEDGSFVDMCNHCFVSGDNTEILVSERYDLASEESDDIEIMEDILE